MKSVALILLTLLTTVGYHLGKIFFASIDNFHGMIPFILVTLLFAVIGIIKCKTTT